MYNILGTNTMPCNNYNIRPCTIDNQKHEGVNASKINFLLSTFIITIW